ncbi:hypothetical protein PVAND_010153 [Polypedilum vanderplanki]|uniref:Uncharacterized protein n=1 Tax=Polypedilum vanderplanki TaxID=319348 RepID=A0A9J6CFU4_POLVA|nr:hypothetical protein PVAND_010153 [Polypedilum vanderplanki]
MPNYNYYKTISANLLVTTHDLNFLMSYIKENEIYNNHSPKHSSKQSQSDLSSFKRWGQSSLRAREDRVRPSSLTASESDVYTKLTNPNKDGQLAFGPTSWGQSFEFLLNDPNGLKIFAEFLKKEFSGENIYFWTACERYRQIVDETERRKEAIAIYEKHLGNGAHEPVNVDSNARNSTRDGLAKAELDLFSSAQKQIFNLMKFDSYQRFIRSDLYKSCIQAEQKNTPMPYASENLDPLLKITLLNGNQTATAAAANNVSSKLKKSLSNAEDRRRKSLLPWNRKTRCKSKDREEENKKNSTSSSNTLKHNSNQSGGDIHSSRSSLSSFDATIAKISSFDDETRNSLCRVILRENGATTIVQIKHDETIRELVERVLDKRGFSYQAYEVFLSGTNKPLDLDTVSKELAGNEVFIEQRVVFKLDLPNRKVISVKSKPSKLLCEVLRPILHKYNYRLDMVHAYSKETNDLIDTSLQVTEVDGMRLLILFKDDCVASSNNNNNINSITEIGQKHVPHNFNMRNAPVTFVRANKLVSSISNPQLNTLDEITNKVFNEVLQCKSTENDLGNGANRNCDQGSIKSEDWGSETETSSGIFNRIRRHKKPQKTTSTVAVATTISKSSAGSESRDESDINGIKKPLIAKWKVGNQKLQVTSRNHQNDESLLENLKRAQCLRIEDQRGTDINFELPDFLKDRNRLSGQKLRKNATSSTPEEMPLNLNLYSNIDSLSPNRNDFNKINASPSQQKPPQPLPRTSLNKSPLKSSPEISSVQSKINSLENAILMNSRSNTPINMNVSTTCMPSTTPIIKNRHSDEFYSENYGETTMIFNHNHRDYHQNNEFRLSQNQKDSPPKLPPKRNFYKITDVPTAQPEIYLDQPSSSFV